MCTLKTVIIYTRPNPEIESETFPPRFFMAGFRRASSSSAHENHLNKTSPHTHVLARERLLAILRSYDFILSQGKFKIHF